MYNFQYHVNATSKILLQNLGIIHKLNTFFLHKFYGYYIFFSLIHLHILYSSSVWHGTFPSILCPIHILQNNAIRSFPAIGNQDLVSSMYSIRNIMPEAGLHDFYTLVYMYKF